MKNNLSKEIEDFKTEVKTNGMYIDTYLKTRKEFIQKIELASENSLRFIRIIYFKSLITKEQYIDYKMRIADAKKYYKQMLAFY